ncbi:MAG: choice-of-anchor D domain-containing protein [Nitrospiraceae bacterium]|nr:MAG: choice-of-anchor D domain-containing protein [Nitrospiraceae bacterium]
MNRKWYVRQSAIFFTIAVFIVCVFTASSNAQGVYKNGNVHPKVASVLAELQDKYETDVINIQSFARERDIKIEYRDKVTVFLISKPDGTVDAIDRNALQSYGVEIVKSGDKVMKAKVPVNMIKQIADNVAGISFIKLPDKPLPLSYTSEGVGLTGASVYHSTGYKGAGVKIAIIDVGFKGLSSAISAGELPGSVAKIDCTSSCTSTTFSNETEDHGTAVAEIVYDMAPEAQLYLMKIDDNLDLKDAKDYCKNNGIKIINHSVGWVNTNFYSGECYYDNPVCTVNDAYSSGILWVNSAGNSAQQHYEAAFSDPDADKWHNVSGSNEAVTIYASAGSTIQAFLTWNAWPATDQDYDLLLYNSYSSISPVASSNTSQTGTQLPIEDIYYPVPASGTYYLKIKKSSATGNHKLEVYSFNHNLNPAVASSSLIGPADAVNAMAVAAINKDKWSTGPYESFSSQGPSNDSRIKPDISGPDGVSSYSYGSFFGTSASSPHVAGAAALILSHKPGYSVSQLWDALTDQAVDMGATGKDNVYGYGRLDLPASQILQPDISVTDTIPPVDDRNMPFGNISAGSLSSQTVTVANSGNADFNIGQIAGANPVATPFEISNDNCSNKVLVPAATCTFKVTFAPSALIMSADSFDIPSDDPDESTVTVSVSGTGTLPTPDIKVSDARGPADDLQMPFENLTEGLVMARAVKIANYGTANLVIGAIALNDQLTPPFEILNDNCSGKVLLPTEDCTITVNFTPTATGTFSDSFDIPSNDSDENPVMVAVSGTGLSSADNNPPSSPELVYPANGQINMGTTLSFRWKNCTDPDLDQITYHFYYSEDPDFIGVTSIQASAGNKTVHYAGTGLGLLLFGMVFAADARTRKKMFLLIVIITMFTMLFVSCGGGGGGGGGGNGGGGVTSDEVTRSVSGLETGTTYYWKVTVDDGKGGITESQVQRFTTQ